jgi:hypothetical protein
MINLKRIFLTYLVVFVVLCCLIFVIKRELAAGLIIGVIIGAMNLAAVTLTVKSFVKQGSQNAAAAFFTVLVYFVKMAFAAGAVAAVVIFRKYFSIMGFLIGFTLTLVILAVEAFFAKMTKETK